MLGTFPLPYMFLQRWVGISAEGLPFAFGVVGAPTRRPAALPRREDVSSLRASVFLFASVVSSHFPLQIPKGIFRHTYVKIDLDFQSHLIIDLRNVPRSAWKQALRPCHLWGG